MRLEAREHTVPAALVAVPPVASARAGALPAALLGVDAGAVLLRREADLDLGRRVPLRGLPREDDPRRRHVRRHEPHVELLSVGEALEEPSALATLEEDVRGPLPAEGEAFLEGPP